MKVWKILGIGIAIALIIANNGVNGIAGKEKPFLSKNEIADFLASLGINEKTISTMNLSDVYLSDIPDNFWSWMNMSKDDSAKMVKDIIHQVTVNETGALEKLIEDGRIHPTRIEETVEKAREDVNKMIKEFGE